MENLLKQSNKTFLLLFIVLFVRLIMRCPPGLFDQPPTAALDSCALPDPEVNSCSNMAAWRSYGVLLFRTSEDVLRSVRGGRWET